VDVAGPAGAGEPISVPHSMQNLAPGGFSAPQAGQRRASSVPHDMQKRARSGFCVPQDWQARATDADDTSAGAPRSVSPVTIGTSAWAAGGRALACRAVPDFLELPERPPKPRDRGITHVIDTGLSTVEAEGLMRAAADYVDMVRLGWGSAYVTRDLRDKLSVYRGHDVPVMLGGTLTELAWLHGRVEELAAWLEELEIDHVEVSSGTVAIPADDKAALIERLARDFTVFAEVGEKDPEALLAPYRWVELIRQALDAGAEQVVCEGRASGDAGMYRPSGEARTGLIDEIVHEIDPARLIFEAPQKHQQIWFIRRFGPDVNLGNVLPQDVISLETLRLGLRADTLKLFHQPG
jgi:phosphosulfolactate synthase